MPGLSNCWCNSSGRRYSGHIFQQVNTCCLCKHSAFYSEIGSGSAATSIANHPTEFDPGAEKRIHTGRVSSLAFAQPAGGGANVTLACAAFVRGACVTRVAASAGDPHLLLAAIRKEIHGLDENLTPYDARTMVEHMELPLAPARVAATSLGAFGGLALLLAAIGIFGVMSNAVTQRTREIGIRIALGADSKEVLKLIVGQGALLVGIGIALGLRMAALGTRLLARLLYGVSTLDPLTFVAVTVLLAATAFLAGFLPARRAIKVDPMVALRQD